MQAIVRFKPFGSMCCKPANQTGATYQSRGIIACVTEKGGLDIKLHACRSQSVSARLRR